MKIADIVDKRHKEHMSGKKTSFKGMSFIAKKIKGPDDKESKWYVVDAKTNEPYAGPYTTQAEAKIHAEELPDLLKD